MYNFLHEVNKGWMNIYAANMRLVLVGKNVDHLSPNETPITIVWETEDKLSNEQKLVFKYNKRKHPNSKWPWPFRNITQPMVIVEGLRLYSGDELLFAFPMDNGPVHLFPGDRFTIDVGKITITI